MFTLLIVFSSSAVAEPSRISFRQMGQAYVLSFYDEQAQLAKDLEQTLLNLKLITETTPGQFEWLGAKDTTVVLAGGFLSHADYPLINQFLSGLKTQGARFEWILDRADIRAYQLFQSSTETLEAKEGTRQFFEGFKDNAHLALRVGKLLVTTRDIHLPVDTQDWIAKSHLDLEDHIEQTLNAHLGHQPFPESSPLLQSLRYGTSPLNLKTAWSTSLLNGTIAPTEMNQILKTANVNRLLIAEQPDQSTVVPADYYAKHLINLLPIPAGSRTSHAHGKMVGFQFGVRPLQQLMPAIQHADTANPHALSLGLRNKQMMCAGGFSLLSASAIAITAGSLIAAMTQEDPYQLPDPNQVDHPTACAKAGGTVPTSSGIRLSGVCLCPDGKLIQPYREKCGS